MSAKHLELVPRIIQELQSTSFDTKAFVGFDGYVDRICKAVKGRSRADVNYFPTLRDFGDKMHYASGKSAQVEVVPVMTKLGGNAPIMAMALARLGFQTTCCGTLGHPQVHPIFEELHNIAQVLSLGDPALTTALEFEDGKLILSDLSAFGQLDFELLVAQLGMESLLEHFQSANLIALVGWSNLPLARDFLESLSRILIPQLDEQPRHFFFDLADTTRKSRAELLGMLESLHYFTSRGTVILGLNENEALHIYESLYSETTPTDTPELTSKLFDALAIDQVLVHPITCACLADKEGVICLDNRLVPDPKILTGAGDNLNAGFCLGLGMGMEKEASLILGMANSGAYITLGNSPNKNELIDYLEVWVQELEIKKYT